MSWDAIRLQNTIQVYFPYGIVIDCALDDRAQSLPRGNVDLLCHPD